MKTDEFKAPPFTDGEALRFFAEEATGEDESAGKLFKIMEMLRDLTRADEAVFVALRSLGLAALRPEPWEGGDPQLSAPGPETSLVLPELRALVLERIESWHYQARNGDLRGDRRRAASLLR